MSIFNLNSGSIDNLSVESTLTVASASVQNLIVSGDLIVNGMDVLNPSNTSYGRLKYDAYSFDVVDECTPRTYFRFDRDAFGLNKWNEASPEKISLSLTNITDYTAEKYEYRKLLYHIIENKLENSIITLTQSVPPAPNSYKKFEIQTGKIYAKKFDQNLSPLYFKKEWGNGWELIDNEMEINPDFRFDELPSLTSGSWYEYIELDVFQVETSRGLTSAPSHDDEFSLKVEFGSTQKRKRIQKFTSSSDCLIPSWAKTIKIYAVGAGGGGGGGASGYGHSNTASYDLTYDEFNEPVMVSTEDAGHETVTGGGGGAGGCVVIKEIQTSGINPGSKLNVIVGRAGEGGSGSSYVDDIPIFRHTNKYRPTGLTPWYLSNTAKELSISRNKFDIYGAPGDELFGESPWDGDKGVGIRLASMLSYETLFWGSKYNGKKGGSSEVWLNASECLVKADGGFGGTAGYALKSFFNWWLHFQIDTGKRSVPIFNKEIRIFGNDINDVPIGPFVPGGGSSILNCIGDTIYPGGHGGYGVSMPNFDHPYEHPDLGVYKLDKLITESVNLSKAPNIPWDKNNDISYMKLPRGHTSTDIDDRLKVYKNSSFEKPTELAPPGGGGGNGVQWRGIDDRLLTDVSNLTLSELGGSNSDPFQWIMGRVYNNTFSTLSTLITSNIKLGEGGKNETGKQYLFNDTDEYGINHTIEIGDGAHGGHAEYYHKTKISGINKPLSSNSLYTLPENVSSRYGVGGGGGAAEYVTEYSDKSSSVRGQDGGKGGPGVVIVVFE